jgi:hypothetical protein
MESYAGFRELHNRFSVFEIFTSDHGRCGEGEHVPENGRDECKDDFVSVKVNAIGGTEDKICSGLPVGILA